MEIDNDNYWYTIGISDIQGFDNYLQDFPQEKDLGEALDCYREKLQNSGTLDEQTGKAIQALHSYHLGITILNGIPFNKTDNPIEDKSEIISFLQEAEEILYKYPYENAQVQMFLKKYEKNRHPYISMEMAHVALDNEDYNTYLNFIYNTATVIFTTPNIYWDNPEAIYACGEVLYNIIHYLEKKGMEELDIMLPGLKSILLEYSYLLLTRVINWPETATEVEGKEYNTPISFRHRVGCLSKRLELMAEFPEYFKPLVPSFSTPQTLIVSDFYYAHELSYAEGVLDSLSQFKRDAREYYFKYINDHSRPFSTTILDGKNDSLEMSYRFYLKYNLGNYQIQLSDLKLLMDFHILKIKHSDLLYEKKEDSDKILDYLKDHQITRFYHFTEKANLANIKRYGGIFSQRQCLEHAIPLKAKGIMLHLREEDAKQYLDDYARVSFCKYHPLIKERIKNEPLVLLEISTEVATLKDTLFSDMDAALIEHHNGGNLEYLKMVDMELVKKSGVSFDPSNPDYKYIQAEVMVKNYIPKKYILNLDKPIEIQEIL